MILFYPSVLTVNLLFDIPLMLAKRPGKCILFRIILKREVVLKKTTRIEGSTEWISQSFAKFLKKYHISITLNLLK